MLYARFGLFVAVVCVHISFLAPIYVICTNLPNWLFSCFREIHYNNVNNCIVYRMQVTKPQLLISQ